MKVSSSEVVGRFAPSPSGPLHFGSIVAAVGSCLSARHGGGRWLLRIEDVDTPRTVAGAADGILRTLERFGFEWDGPVVWQSARTQAYRDAFERLRDDGRVFGCACTRKEMADSALARDGTVWCWGYNEAGQADNGATPRRRAASPWELRAREPSGSEATGSSGSQSASLRALVTRSGSGGQAPTAAGRYWPGTHTVSVSSRKYFAW